MGFDVTYDLITDLYRSDKSLFQPYIDERWQDGWVHTWYNSIDDMIVDEPSYENNSVSKSSNSELVNYETLDDHSKASFHGWLLETGRVNYWPDTPDVKSPDAYGFYLPFHVSRDLHGIYLIEEYCNELARHISVVDDGTLAGNYPTIARLFIYYHEAFHHKVEMFATRLEIVLQRRCYLTSVKKLYEETRDTEHWEEEFLANIHAFMSTISYLRKKRGLTKLQILQAERVLIEIIKLMPAGYREAAKHLSVRTDREERVSQLLTSFWSEIHIRLMPDSTPYEQEVWAVGYFDYPLNKVNGRINFLTHRDSLILNRTNLNNRYLSTRELKKKLEPYAEVRLKRQGKGSHEIWLGPSGRSVAVPRKSELKIGLIGGILKDLGVNLTAYELLRSSKL